MNQKKKLIDFLLWFLLIAVLVFVGFHVGMALDWADKNPIIRQTVSGTVEEYDWLGLFERLEYTLFRTPFQITWTEYTETVLIFVGAIVLVLFVRSILSERDFVENPYGSSKWGTLKQFLQCGWRKTRKTLIKDAKTNFRDRKKVIRKDKSLRGKREEKKEKIRKEKLSLKRKIKSLKKQVTKWSELIFSAEIRSCIYTYGIANNNILCYGGSGSGKTRGFVMPTILNLAGRVLKKHGKLWNKIEKYCKEKLKAWGVEFDETTIDGCSFVITDPKGEVYRKARYFLEFMGYKVRCLNLFEKSKTHHYNPLHYIHTDREGYDWEEKVLELIDVMIANLDGGEGKRGVDPFWTDAPIHCLQSLFFLVLYAFPKEQQNMNTVMWLLGQLDVADDDTADDEESPLDIIFESFAHGWKDENGVEHEGFGEENIAYRTYRDFRSKATGRTGRSIAMTIIAKLQPYNIASVRAMSDRDELMLDRLGEEKIALFVIVPPTSKTFNYIAGMMFQQTFDELNYCANALHGGRLPINVIFLLDEFANTCVINNFSQIIAYARSLGIAICPILQSRGQIQSMYEKDYKTILDNCATTIYLGGISEDDTLKSFSERLGKGTYYEKDSSVTKSSVQAGSTNESTKQIGRELKTPSELEQMPLTDCIVMVKGKRPMYCKKYNYKSHPNYKYTSDYDYELADKPVEEDEEEIKKAWEAKMLVEQEEHTQEVIQNARSQIVSRMMELDFKETFDEKQIWDILSKRYLGTFEIPLEDFSFENEDDIDELIEDIIEDNRRKEEEKKDAEVNKNIIQNVIKDVDVDALISQNLEQNDIKTSEKLEDIADAMQKTNALIEQGKEVIPSDSTYPQDGEEEDEEEIIWDEDDDVMDALKARERSEEMLRRFLATSADTTTLRNVVSKEEEEAEAQAEDSD